MMEPSGKVKREQEAHHQGPRRVPGAAPLGPRQVASWLPWVAPRLLPSPIFTPRIRNPWTETLFHETLFVPPPPPFQDRGCLEKLLRHPVGRRYPLRETIHSHGRLPYVP